MKTFICTVLLIAYAWSLTAKQHLAELTDATSTPSKVAPSVGFAYFQLNGSQLSVLVVFDLIVSPGRAGIFGPATPYGQGKQVFDLGHQYSGEVPFCGGCFTINCGGGTVLGAEVTITDAQKSNLLAGRYYLSVLTPPVGEVRGQIVPRQPLALT